MEHRWTSRREISGFGGDYEEECRNMVLRGVHWLEEHPESDPSLKVAKDVFGLISPNNEDANELIEAILGGDGSQTGAMVHAAVTHALYANSVGWETYQQKMDEREDEERESRDA